jgi:tetratricopeptide (TPR) repeat protein
MDENILKHQALVLWMHGQTHHLRGDLERAIELYRKSLEVWPTAEAYTFLGWAHIHAQKGMVLRAIREFEAALEIHPGEASCRSALAELRGALN